MMLFYRNHSSPVHHNFILNIDFINNWVKQVGDLYITGKFFCHVCIWFAMAALGTVVLKLLAVCVEIGRITLVKLYLKFYSHTC
jgi:hypothetical protein